MADHIITPSQTRWEKIKTEVKSFSPQVKQGLIMASVTVLIALVAAIGNYIIVLSENSRLKTKVHELELEVLPFRNLAVQQFNKADAESLKKLAEIMATLHHEYSNQLETIKILRLEIEALRNANQRTDKMLSGLRRPIPADKEEDVIKVLSALPKARIQISCCGAIAESALFARELHRTFKASGFDVDLAYNMGTMDLTGAQILVNSAKTAPRCAAVIQQLFGSLGFSFVGVEASSLSTNEIHLNIFNKNP